MSINRRTIAAPPEAVFAVLSDARVYGHFVVGSKRIRRFEPTWPELGTVIHHTLGFGPLVLRDQSRVVEVEENRRLVLRARMRPFAVNRVAFTLRPIGSGRSAQTELEVEEKAIEGPAAAWWNALLDRLMWLRNWEMLRRVGRLAERRMAHGFQVADSGGDPVRES